MSNEIFYTQVDENLAAELNARAVSSIRRTTRDINYIAAKVANVRVTPFVFNSNDVYSVEPLASLGGTLSRSESYLPTGKNGFLTEKPITGQELEWVVDPKSKMAVPIIQNVTKTTSIHRTPPFLSSAEIAIGDHTMGLLNTATFVIEIPNVGRDINMIEELYMRPGRKIKMEIEYHPDAVITELELDTNTLPSKDKLKELYGTKIDIDSKLREISKMNRAVFEGLITSFDLSYNSDYTATVTINCRGTSNVLPDVTAFMNKGVVDKNSAGKQTTNPITNPTEYENSILLPTGSGTTSFYEQLYTEAEALAFSNISINEFALALGTLGKFDVNVIAGQDDDWILFGNAFATTGVETKNDTKTYRRYITLNRLIVFINKYITSKLNLSVSVPEIICTSAICNSSYYENIVSADPYNILLLPEDSRKGTTEKYGNTVFFETLNFGNWPGFLGNDRSYPARIFLFLPMIKDILDELDKNANGSSYPISNLLNKISEKIEYATGGAIKLKLITHPVIDSLLAFYDEKYLGQPGDTAVVKPYHVPMHAKLKTNEEDSVGSILLDFKMSAKLPDSAATLAYVLNQDPAEISEDDIAPYVNTMYQFNDPEKLKKAEEKYGITHKTYLDQLQAQKSEYGKNMTNEETRVKLYEALVKHIQFPYAKLTQSQQALAPIFPWDVSFTIDGVNGFRYGDVLTFDALPTKYTANTVFSIIGITHSVSQDGQWKTDIKCIMRPRLDK